MKIDLLKKNKLPDKPGVYFFLGPPKRSEGGKNKSQILYIGKATSLRSRTKSYFAKDLISTRGPLILDMVFKADKVDWQETDSVLEAIILEANLIKKHQPYYNTKEKDDKSFLNVVITKEKLPRVFTVRSRNYSGRLENTRIAKTYGPFTNGPQLREALKIVRRIFPFLDDKSKNYLEFYKQINLIPDINDRKLYLQNIRNIKLFFSGKKKQIFTNLKKEMKGYAKVREFEKAGEIKRQMFALQHINDVALLKQEYARRHSHSVLEGQELSGRSEDSSEHIPVSVRIEAYDIAHMGDKNMTGVMVVVEDGEVSKNEYRKFKIRTQAGANDTGALKEVLERRFRHQEWRFPDLIVVDGGVAQINVAKQVVTRFNLVTR